MYYMRLYELLDLQSSNITPSLWELHVPSSENVVWSRKRKGVKEEGRRHLREQNIKCIFHSVKAKPIQPHQAASFSSGFISHITYHFHDMCTPLREKLQTLEREIKELPILRICFLSFLSTRPSHHLEIIKQTNKKKNQIKPTSEHAVPSIHSQIST